MSLATALNKSLLPDSFSASSLLHNYRKILRYA